MGSLQRMGKHLPGRRLLGQLPPDDRLDVDALGTFWVTEDPLLVVLKGHLLIETALVDICDRILKNASALERNLRFSTRLNLVCALLEPEYLSESVVAALRDFNQLRNSLAHNLEVPNFEKKLEQFFRRFDEFEGLRPPPELEEKETVTTRLSHCIAFLSAQEGLAGVADDLAEGVEEQKAQPFGSGPARPNCSPCLISMSSSPCRGARRGKLADGA
jgi:hypothetical protein